MAKKILPCGSLKNTMTTAAIRMGDGHVVHSCGDCEVEVPMGSGTIAHRFYVCPYRSLNQRFTPWRRLAVLTPQGCKTSRRNNARRQGTLADPVAPAARHLPRHGESSSMRTWTRTTEAPATPTPNRHHLPAIPDAGPRGPAPNGCTSPPFSRQSSASDRQCFTRVPRRAADGASSSSAASLPGSAALPLSGGPHAAGTREPAADRRPAQGMGGQPSPQPPNRQGTEGTSQQRGHDVCGSRADAEMTVTSGPQESADPLPAATTRSVPQQREPSTEYAPGGHPGTTTRHPSPTSATLDQDRVTIPSQPPRGHRSKGSRVPSTTWN